MGATKLQNVPSQLLAPLLVFAARLVVVLLAHIPGFVGAETITVAAGEYAPFVSQQLADDGVTAAIVSAAFKSQGVTVVSEFLPWKRGFSETQQGKYTGTFPYLKTAEREVDFLYSEPIYTDRFRLFVRTGDGQHKSWVKNSLCIPLGYDTTQIEKFIADNKIRLEQPPEISNCFHMLDRGRVDAVWVSQLVGYDTAATLYGKNLPIAPLDMNLVGSTQYYFIISRQLPDAQRWLTRFNDGLKLIRKNGVYGQIVKKYGGK